MNGNNNPQIRHLLIILVAVFISALNVTPAVTGEYTALNGVKGIKAVFDVSLESPQMANIVFWAVQDVYKNKSVLSLKETPQVAVDFSWPRL